MALGQRPDLTQEGSPASPGIPALRTVRSLLPSARQVRSVVVLCQRDDPTRLTAWLAELADDRVVVLDAGTDLAGLTDLTRHLRRVGPVDLMIDLLASDRLPADCTDRRALLSTVLPHLAKGGAVVHDRAAARDDRGAGMAATAALVDTDGDVAALAITPELLVVTQRHHRYLMLREADVPEVLAQREPDLSVDEVQVLPAGSLTSRTTVHHHGDEPTVAPMHDVIHHPRLVTRRYRGTVALSGRTLTWSGHSVLPDSFRWHLAERLSHPMLDDARGGLARMKPRHAPVLALEGDYYQLESTYPSHFGHVLTEVVSRMWGWDEAKRRHPGLRLLVHPRPGFDNVVERAVFAAFGIPADDIRYVTEPVEVRSVLSATPMWHNAEPHYVHPAIADVWARIGEGLSRHESDAPTAERIFVSRSDATANNDRSCRNQREVERRFADRGYAVVYPEQHPLPDQARIFREARVVAGFGGSALFNVMHTRRLEALVVLNHSGYFARNEHLFAAVKGGDSHYFWSTPDVVPSDPLSKQALRSSWEFDTAALGDELDRTLAAF